MFIQLGGEAFNPLGMDDDMKSAAAILGFLILTVSMRTFGGEEELARVEKNMGKVASIQLLQEDGGTSNSKLTVRTTLIDGSQQNLDITQFQYSVRELLNGIDDATDPIVTKTRETICYMIPHPGPELFVRRIDRSGPRNTVQLVKVLTNLGCAFSSWLAPKSEAGETSARILYRFIFDASGQPSR